MKSVYVYTPGKVKISVRHIQLGFDTALIVAPGFFQSKETPTFKKIEKALSDSFGVLSMDFRGHGKSNGLYTFSAREKEDLKSVIDYARTFYKKIGVLGFSYGGTIAILEQVEFHNIDSLICVSSPMASSEIEFKWWTSSALKLGIKGLEPGAGVRPGNPYLKKINAIDVVEKVRAPILFIHGSQDPTVSQRHSEKLYQAAKDPKSIKIFPAASHAEEIYRRYPVEFIQTIKEWLKKCL